MLKQSATRGPCLFQLKACIQSSTLIPFWPVRPPINASHWKIHFTEKQTKLDLKTIKTWPVGALTHLKIGILLRCGRVYSRLLTTYDNQHWCLTGRLTKSPFCPFRDSSTIYSHITYTMPHMQTLQRHELKYVNPRKAAGPDAGLGKVLKAIPTLMSNFLSNCPQTVKIGQHTTLTLTLALLKAACWAHSAH